MKNKFYWKVALKQDQRYISPEICRGMYCLEYEVGKVTTSILPNGVFCFNTRREAR